VGRRYLTFDCYGTLVDWEGGIHAAFGEYALIAGLPAPPRARLLELHARIEPEVQAGPYRRYREVLAETARRMAHELGWEMEPRRGAFLAESLPGWPPFDDTCAALERLARAGHTLGILSNVDDDLLAATLRQIDVDIPLRITAEQVRSYKPAHGHFVAARARIGDAPWLHAAQSWFHDIVPTHTLGIKSAWVNRKREPRPDDAAPDHEVPDLRTLAARLG
jgi:2-haloalkanoic acid dehalogenase type II